MKFLLIILDGGADAGEKTPYQEAKKPNIDSLAKKGVCGMLDIGYKDVPQSDLGFLKIMGCFSEQTYTGRGYLEGLGLGMEEITEDDVCVCGNFATLADNGNILSRNAGRDATGLEELADEINGIESSTRLTAGSRCQNTLCPMIQ